MKNLPNAQASFEVYNSPLPRVRRPRLRVRLLGRRPRDARRLGSAVRRLRQRRADHRRPVPRLRPLEVGTDVTTDAAPAARLRGKRAGAFERAAGAVPSARGAGKHPDREPEHVVPAFHLLRRQALDPNARPLIVMTPKGSFACVRPPGRWRSSPKAASSRFSTTTSIASRSGGSSSALERSTTTSPAMTSGPSDPSSRSPGSNSSTRFRRAGRATRRLVPRPGRGRLGPGGAPEHGRVAGDPTPARGGDRGRVPLRYVGRPWRASPSEGYPTAHLQEQERIVKEVLSAA